MAYGLMAGGRRTHAGTACPVPLNAQPASTPSAPANAVQGVEGARLRWHCKALGYSIPLVRRSKRNAKPHIYYDARYKKWVCGNMDAIHRATTPVYAWRGWNRNMQSLQFVGRYR
jgi:hypothetical protein